MQTNYDRTGRNLGQIFKMSRTLRGAENDPKRYAKKL